MKKTIIEESGYAIYPRLFDCGHGGVRGGSTVYGHIMKEGGRWMRWALTEAVNSHLRNDTELTRLHRWLVSNKLGQVATTITAKKILKRIPNNP